MRIEASADYHGIASRGACSGPGNEVIAHRAYYRFVLRSLQVWEMGTPDGRGGRVSQKEVLVINRFSNMRIIQFYRSVQVVVLGLRFGARLSAVEFVKRVACSLE